MKSKIIIAAAVAAPMATTTTAGAAAPVNRAQAERLTRQAASYKAKRYGMSLPPSAWTVACYRAAHSRWRCEAGAMRGYCNARADVGGTASRPVVRRVAVHCLE